MGGLPIAHIVAKVGCVLWVGVNMAYVGSVDLSRHSHAEGWVSQGTEPGSVHVFVNGVLVGVAKPTQQRPDVHAAGFALLSGWMLGYAEPLTASDTVVFKFPDGREVPRGPHAEHVRRIKQMTHGLNRETMRGLEIGPLNYPLLGKKHWKVDYVDHASYEDLRAKYGRIPSEDIGCPMVAPDVVWPSGPLLPCVPAGARYNFVLASHVIEHVPDLLSWLESLSDVLVDGGLINLAAPSRDRTFDRFREVTRAAEIVDDFVRKNVRPSPRQIFDHVCFASPIGLDRQYRPVDAMSAVANAEATGEYMDVHCRVFTDESFLSVCKTLADAGLLKLKLAAMFPTLPTANEFIVSLRKQNGSSAAEVAQTYATCLAELPRLQAEIAARGDGAWVAKS